MSAVIESSGGTARDGVAKVGATEQGLPPLSAEWLAVLAYTVAVILFGAWVRISGSGDGCGQHWPTCQGELVHLPRKLATVIEMTHRVTSGLCLVAVIGAARRTWSRRPAGHPARRAALWSFVFVLGEALVGAVIVLAKKTGNDTSLARAIIMALHLVNTCLLTFALAWAARADAPGADGAAAEGTTAGGNRAEAVRFDFSAPRARWALWGALGLLLVSAAGAVTALGDTVFPATEHSLLANVGGNAHFLQQVRGFHPVLATLVSGLAFWLSVRIARSRLALRVFHASLTAQLALGVANVWLLAPGWMQVLHLGVANAVWLAWCWLLLEAAEGQPAETVAPAR
ncbi:MAG TPA: COX15/CtaA family protein [Polyangiaceae bacterium]|nr:COX15/CtaA family protein [Polyangiaceae bacterium]